MKDKGFLFKILALISAVASVVFACLIKFCFRAAAGGEKIEGSTNWSIFSDATKADKTQIAQFGGIGYDPAIRTFAVFLIVVIAIIVIILIALSLYGKFSKNPFEACSGSCNILSVVVSLLGIGLLITILSYVNANTATVVGVTAGVAVANVVMLVLSISFSVLTSVLYIIGAVNTKK